VVDPEVWEVWAQEELWVVQVRGGLQVQQVPGVELVMLDRLEQQD